MNPAEETSHSNDVSDANRSRQYSCFSKSAGMAAHELGRVADKALSIQREFVQKSSWICSNLHAVRVHSNYSISLSLAEWEPISYPLRLTSHTPVLWECVLRPCQTRESWKRDRQQVTIDFHFTGPPMASKGIP